MGLTSRLNTAVHAGRLAGVLRSLRRADDEEARHAIRRRLATLLGQRRGAGVKIGQFLSDGSGDDPLVDLRETLKPLPKASVSPVVADVDPMIAEEMEAEAEAAASFAQVHRWCDAQDREWAVKIRYPGILEQLRDELALLGLIPGWGPVRKWGLDLDGFRQEIASDLQRECDYRLEASHQSGYRMRWQGHGGLVVPEVHERAFGEAVLVQRWEQGVGLDEACTWSTGHRRILAEILIEHLMRGIADGVLHADLQPGNVRFRSDPQPAVVLYDYGSVASWDPERGAAWIRLLIALRQRDDVDAIDLLDRVGFDPDKLRAIAEQLPAVLATVAAPWLHEGRFDLAQWDPSADLQAILGEARWWFRSAGAPDLLLWMRAFAGTVALVRGLGVACDWWQVIENRCPDVLPLATAVPVRPGFGQALDASCAHLARFLRVQVRRAGKLSVDLCMPARVLDDLDAVLNNELRQRIERRGLQLSDLVADIRAGGYRCGTVLELDDEDPQVRLELTNRGR